MATDLLDSEQINSIAGLPTDLALLRMENDSIQALAAARPRNFEKMKAELEQQLTAFPQLAEGAIYRKPLGREDECTACKTKCFPDKSGGVQQQCWKCKKEGTIVQGPMKHANGLSVRTAETLAEAYGYNRVRAEVTQIDDDTVKVEATFTDYQRGRIWQDSGIVSKKYKKKNGTTDRTPDDRFFNLVVKAAASKHVREVILRSVNPGLKQWYWEKCEEIARSVLLDDKTIDRLVAAFAKYKVDLEALERHLGVPRGEWNQEHKLILIGVGVALKDGETTVWEAFQVGDPPPDEDAEKQKPGVTKGESVKKANGKADPEKKPTARVAIEQKASESQADYWIRAMRAQPTLETLNAVWSEAEADQALDVADTSAVKAQYEKLAKSFTTTKESQ